MIHIELKDCRLIDSIKICPECDFPLYELLPLRSDTDFKKYYICKHCNFLGGIDVDQVSTTLIMLKENNTQLVDFKINKVLGFNPLSVTFQSNCFNIDESDWLWDFGDGHIGKGEVVEHTYENPGTYDVKLDVLDSKSGRLYTIKRDVIKVLQFSKPKSEFEATITTGNGKLETQFKSLSEGTDIISYIWDFGDNKFSYIKDPYHLYSSEGTYTVSLTIKNLNGDISIQTKEDYITINPQQPTSEFNAAPLKIWAPNEVKFSYIGEASVDSCYWDFGDGNVSDSKFTSHEYDSTGLYDISLTTYNSTGEYTLTKNDYIEVLPYTGPPSVNFEEKYNTHLSILPQYISFIDKSESCGILSWFWEFGNGKTSTEQNPTTIFDNYGIYEVSLTVEDSHRNINTFNKQLNIDIGTPVANFEYEIDSLNQRILCKNTSQGQYLTYSWDFGDDIKSLEENPKHIYISKGEYIVTLIIKNTKGTDTITKTIIID